MAPKNILKGQLMKTDKKFMGLVINVHNIKCYSYDSMK